MCKRLSRSVNFVRIVVFFFQAEDGIRDYKVTGVQTCALPICFGRASDMPRYLDLKRSDRAHGGPRRQLTCRTRRAIQQHRAFALDELAACGMDRSEERRVGKEWRSRWAPDH